MMNRLVFGVITLLFLSFPGFSDPICVELSRRLVAELEQRYQTDKNVPFTQVETALRDVDSYLATKKPSLLKRPVHFVRDLVREIFMRLRKHDYPLIAVTEVAQASTWAKAAFNVGKNRPSVDAAEATQDFKPEQTHARLQATLASLKTFPDTMRNLLDQAVEREMKISALEAGLATPPEVALKNPLVEKALHHAFLFPGREYNIPVTESTWTRKEDGSPDISRLVAFYPTRIAAKNDLDRLRSGKSAWIFWSEPRLKQEIRERVLDHTNRLKIIETYMAELQRQWQLNPDADLPPAYKAIWDDARDLYVENLHGHVKDAYRPPSWAWQSMKWKQFFVEVRTLWTQDITNLRKQFTDGQIGQLVEITKNMTPEERKAIGINEITEVGKRWWNIKGTRVATTLALISTPTSLPAIWEHVQKVWLYMRTKHLECAQMETDEQFIDCAKEHLANEFPKRFEEAKANPSILYNADGSIADPEIALEFKALLDARNQHLARKATEEYNNAQADQALLSGVKGSDLFLENLYHLSDRAAFEATFMEEFLKVRYAALLAYPTIETLVVEAIHAPGKDLQKQALDKLAGLPGTKPLVTDLKMMLEKRTELFPMAEPTPDPHISGEAKKGVPRPAPPLKADSDPDVLVP